MKKLVVALLAALSLNALAMDAVTLLRPSPLGVVIAVNSYLKDQKKVYYIRVESQAQDFEKAKKQAFRLASEQVAGTVVLSESELRNSNLTRDEIVTYSSGLIDEYKIVDRYDGAGFVKLTMDVWIVESVMAQRLLAKSATEKGIDGNSLSTRAESILDERQRGDIVIQTILNDFPKRAFRVELVPAAISMDTNRNTRAVVGWEVKWDDRYVNAITDAASHVGQKPCRWNCPSGQVFFLNNYQFEDPIKLNMVLNHVRSSKATLQVELRDLHGNLVSRTCQPVAVMREDWGSPYPNSALVTDYPNAVIVGGKNSVKGQTQFVFGKNIVTMPVLDQIRADVVTKTQCRPV